MAKRSSSNQADPSLLAPAWGSLWGVALGTWLLLPDIVKAHHIRPEGSVQWFVLLLALVVIFAIIGAFLGFVGSFLIVVVERFTVGSFRDRGWAYGLFTGVLIVAGYGFEDFLIGFMTVGRFFDLLSIFSNQLTGFVLLAGAMAASLTFVYRVITRRVRHLRPIVLAIVLGVAGAAGAVAAPALCAENLLSADVGPLERSAASTEVPLLFIGLDGATWRVLGPAMDRGLAPTLRSLVDRGTSGDVEALWPPYWSGAAWASILTGLPREATGVYEDHAALAPGLPPFQVPLLSAEFKLNPMYTVRSILQAAHLIDYVPLPRALLRGKPVWQLLHEAGVNSAVIQFGFTYPPNDEADVIVSDWLGSDDAWEGLSVRRKTTPDTVKPASLAGELLTPYRSASTAANVFAHLIPGSLPDHPGDALHDSFGLLRGAAGADERSLQVAESLLRRNARQPFLAVYLVGLDSAEHAFWRYRFAEDFATDKPSPEDLKRFGPVIDRYVQYIDERLKTLLALYDEEPNVVVVSDHGHGRSTIPGIWQGWHATPGFFVASGPSVRKTKNRINVSYYDIVPTLASLKGFDKSSGLSGVALFGEHQQLDAASKSQ